MFNCIWKGKTINAYEISKSDITEKEIRIAAHNGELRCICPDCGSKIIYKHGDQIGPHFAHDKNDSIVLTPNLRRTIKLRYEKYETSFLSILLLKVIELNKKYILKNKRYSAIFYCK